MRINRIILWSLATIIFLLSSCTYDYVYEIYEGNSVKRYTITDDGFHNKTIAILEEYGASTTYYNREKYIQEFDKNGNLLEQFKMDLKFVDNFVSALGTAYIVVKVAMNAGEMGYICTDPIELKPGGINEIILDTNSPVHVELNVSEDEVEKRYTITDDGFHNKTIVILEEYGASTTYYDREKYIQEFDKNGNLLKQFKMDLKFVDNFVSAPGTAYIVVKVAMNAGEMGYICTDPIELKPWVLNEIVIDENTAVHVELNS